jgi:hypothetical protein
MSPWYASRDNEERRWGPYLETAVATNVHALVGSWEEELAVVHAPWAGGLAGFPPEHTTRVGAGIGRAQCQEKRMSGRLRQNLIASFFEGCLERCLAGRGPVRPKSNGRFGCRSQVFGEPLATALSQARGPSAPGVAPDGAEYRASREWYPK